jgi:hypothetical protein
MRSIGWGFAFNQAFRWRGLVCGPITSFQRHCTTQHSPKPWMTSGCVAPDLQVQINSRCRRSGTRMWGIGVNRNDAPDPVLYYSTGPRILN